MARHVVSKPQQATNYRRLLFAYSSATATCRRRPPRPGAADPRLARRRQHAGIPRISAAGRRCRVVGAHRCAMGARHVCSDAGGVLSGDGSGQLGGGGEVGRARVLCLAGALPQRAGGSGGRPGWSSVCAWVQAPVAGGVQSAGPWQWAQVGEHLIRLLGLLPQVLKLFADPQHVSTLRGGQRRPTAWQVPTMACRCESRACASRAAGGPLQPAATRCRAALVG